MTDSNGFDYSFNTAVLFLVFNRLDTTQKVFKAIRQSRPPRLYIASDAAREGRKEEFDIVMAVREYVIKQIDWDCEVKTLFQEKNLGCKVAVSTAINWFFDNEDRGIILEDDCLPNPSFFRYCEEMLTLYKDDERVGMISGDNFQFGNNAIEESYYFSRYPHIWGWATWKRAWDKYDVDIKLWPKFNNNYLKSLNFSRREISFWSNAFDSVFNKRIDTWDYQWVFTMWANGMLTVIPRVNLISNIGFGENATHTKRASIYSNMENFKLSFPLKHPVFHFINQDADLYVSKTMFDSSIFGKLQLKLKAFIGKFSGVRNA